MHRSIVGWKNVRAIANEARRRKTRPDPSSRMDETYIKVKGQWCYLYRAVDKSGSNTAALFNMNCVLALRGWCRLITVRRAKYLNNIVEHDHRFIKKIARSMQTFKSFNSASATLAGIEVAHMICKAQFGMQGQSGFVWFARMGADVTALDCDPNKSLTRWASHGLPKGVTLHSEVGRSEIATTIKNADGDGKVVIVDLEGVASQLGLLH